MVVPLFVGREKSIKALQEVMKTDKSIVLSAQKNSEIDDPNDKDIYTSKDFGRLKYSVPEFINSDQELSSLIVSIKDAKIKDGGEGAIIIMLKNL